MSNIYYIFAFITLVLSIIVLVLTVTWLHCGACKRSRLKYTAVLIAALAAGLQPYFFSQLPGLGNVLLVLSLLWLLVDGEASLKAHQHAHSKGHETMGALMYGGE